jgi:PAS domain S-box-containing protein
MWCHIPLLFPPRACVRREYVSIIIPKVKKLPAWTWALPLLLFQFATGLSLNFQIMPRMALWYIPIPLGILLIHWWGPRVLVGLYLNAVLSMPYWGHSDWRLWPLYALPETLTVALSWLLFAKLARGKPWLPDLRNTVQFLVLGLLVPSLAASFYSEAQYVLLGEAFPGNLWQAISTKTVLNLLSPIALTIPPLLFATSLMERKGLAALTGSYPRPALFMARFNSWMKVEAGAIFTALLIASLALSLQKSWFIFGALLLWTSIRFGIGTTVLACAWTICLTLMLPALFGTDLGSAFLTKASVVQVNLNLAVLCFSALVVGRALSDLLQEVETRKEAQIQVLRTAMATAENEAKYRTLFESATDAVMLTEEGKYIECNRYSLEMFRCEPEFLIGKSVASVSPEFQPDGSRSEDAARETRSLAMAGRPVRFEWKYLRKDGTTFDGEGSLTPLMIGGSPKIMVVIRDITDRKMIDRALMESEERFRQMAENIQEIFFLMDRASRTMLYMSPVAEQILGLPLAQLRSRPMALYQFIDPEDRERLGLRREGEDDWEWRALNVDYRFRRPDKRLIWLRLRTELINDVNGRPYRVAGVISDITEYKTAQETARTQQQQLMQADKMNSLGLMVSGVAHEINNPNNLIMLNSDVLETFWKHMRPALRAHAEADPGWKPAGMAYDNAEGKFETLLNGVSGGARRIKRIVDNLKDFARMDSGGMAESIAIDKVIDASVSIVENMIRRSTDKFTISHGPDLPRIDGNFQKLEQVIINLITNACQALENRAQAIVIATRLDGDSGEVVITVKDEGKGIPGDVIGKVADPFFTTKRDKGGTGLGLSVSYGIVKEHRGRLDFRSQEGKGTEVEIRIPARPGKVLEASHV